MLAIEYQRLDPTEPPTRVKVQLTDRESNFMLKSEITAANIGALIHVSAIRVALKATLINHPQFNATIYQDENGDFALNNFADFEKLVVVKRAMSECRIKEVSDTPTTRPLKQREEMNGSTCMYVTAAVASLASNLKTVIHTSQTLTVAIRLDDLEVINVAHQLTMALRELEPSAGDQVLCEKDGTALKDEARTRGMTFWSRTRKYLLLPKRHVDDRADLERIEIGRGQDDRKRRRSFKEMSGTERLATYRSRDSNEISLKRIAAALTCKDCHAVILQPAVCPSCAHFIGCLACAGRLYEQYTLPGGEPRCPNCRVQGNFISILGIKEQLMTLRKAVDSLV